MNRLTDLPNIGPVLAANLRKIGVEKPEQLRALERRAAAQVDDVCNTPSTQVL